MIDLEKAKEITNRLYEFQGQDFSNQRVKFRFASAVQECLRELHMNGIKVYQDNMIFGPYSQFLGVTFEHSEDIPMYVFGRI